MADGTRRGRNIVIGVVVALVVALVALRMALPHVAKRYVNDTLDQHPVYDGRIGDVDIALVRGAYAIHDIEVVKQNGEVVEPFFAAEVVDLSVLWSALWKGSVAGEIVMTKPRLNFVTDDDPGADQTGAEGEGEDANWREIVLELFPVRIDRLVIVDGEVRYVDRTAEPLVIDVELEGVQAEATNLTNVRDLPEEQLTATIVATGRDENYGDLELDARFDSLAEHPTFDLDLRLAGLRMIAFNEFLSRYGKFDLEQGRMDLNLEIAASDGNFEGYVKPVLYDVEILAKDEIRREGVKGVVDAVAGVVKGIFTNPEEKQLATRIPVSGTFDDPDVGVWDAVFGAVRNAFIEALENGIDNTISMADAEGD